MNKLRLVFEVARWEFARFFKLKDVIATVLILLFLAVLVGGSMWLVQRSVRKPKVAVINAQILQLDMVQTPGFDLRFARAEEESALRESIRRREIEGLLIIRDVDTGELVTSGGQLWTNQLVSLLTNARRQSQLTQLNLTSNELANLNVPFQITSSTQVASGRPSSRMEQIYVGVVICLMILAIFACYQYQFTSITGEKHRRVTEQIISAISPQVWMDGKILGISAVGLALMAVYGGTTLLLTGLVMWFAGSNLTQILPLVSPPLTVLILLLALLGILFWNCFFAAIAATVDDPNTSSRAVIMFLPFLPVTITMAGMQNPGSATMRFLGIFPLTSPAALSARLVLTDVAVWEVVTSIGLLLITIWLLRKAAARIFRLAMLMYGKEPSLKEMARWLYES